MMAFTNDFVLAILVNGQVLRESSGCVHLPFGSEYTVRLKNNNTRRAVAKIRIDGTDVAQAGFILPVHGSVDIERFVVDGNLYGGRRFKFVSLDHPDVQDPTSHANGLVEVEFELERCAPQVVINQPVIQGNWQWWDNIGWYNTTSYPPIGANVMYCANMTGGAPRAMGTISYQNTGATVEGSHSNQTFGTGYVDTDPSTRKTLRLQLRAPYGVTQAVTVNNTQYKYCSHCGTRNRWKANYCTKCGASVR